MSDNPIAKFKAELHKHFGFVLCTPLCGLIFNALVFSMTKDDMILIKFLLSLTLTAIGLSFIIKAIEIMEKGNARTHQPNEPSQ